MKNNGILCSFLALLFFVACRSDEEPMTMEEPMMEEEEPTMEEEEPHDIFGTYYGITHLRSKGNYNGESFDIDTMYQDSIVVTPVDEDNVFFEGGQGVNRRMMINEEHYYLDEFGSRYRWEMDLRQRDTLIFSASIYGGSGGSNSWEQTNIDMIGVKE